MASLGSPHLFKSVVEDMGGYVAALLAHIPYVYNILEFPQLLDLGFTFTASLTACSGAPRREFEQLSGLSLQAFMIPAFLHFTCLQNQPHLDDDKYLELKM